MRIGSASVWYPLTGSLMSWQVRMMWRLLESLSGEKLIWWHSLFDLIGGRRHWMMSRWIIQVECEIPQEYLLTATDYIQGWEGTGSYNQAALNKHELQSLLQTPSAPQPSQCIPDIHFICNQFFIIDSSVVQLVSQSNWSWCLIYSS